MIKQAKNIAWSYIEPFLSYKRKSGLNATLVFTNSSSIKGILLTKWTNSGTVFNLVSNLRFSFSSGFKLSDPSN